MLRFAAAAVALLLLPTALVAALPPAFDAAAAEIDRFRMIDERHPYPKKGVVFVGESNVKRWDINRFFPGLKPLNRGFAGGKMSDVARHVDRLILRHEPRLVVLYTGDNDVTAGRTAEQIAADFDAVAKTVAAKLPATKLVVLSIVPTPKSWDRIEPIQAANAAIAETALRHENVAFVDVLPQMLDASGNPDAGLFEKDGVHLRDGGFLYWADAVRPHVESAAK